MNRPIKPVEIPRSIPHSRQPSHRSEIHEFDAVVLVNDNVLVFEVAMDEAALFEVEDDVNDLGKDFLADALVESAAVEGREVMNHKQTCTTSLPSHTVHRCTRTNHERSASHPKSPRSPSPYNPSPSSAPAHSHHPAAHASPDFAQRSAQGCRSAIRCHGAQ